MYWPDWLNLMIPMRKPGIHLLTSAAAGLLLCIGSVTGTANAAQHSNNLGMDFIEIAAGQFDMGSLPEETGHLPSEGPQHNVTLTTAFYMQVTEVTQRQWREVMGENPSVFASFNCDECPVDSVSWDDAQEFIRLINQRCEGRYRLPTEAEWEFSARAGTTTAYYFSDQPVLADDLDANLYYDENSGSRSQRVAQKQGNAWGLYDMHGNVAEWVSDWYAGYADMAATDPTGLSYGTERVVRGCSYLCSENELRAAYRASRTPDSAHVDLGLRLVLEADSVPAEADCDPGVDADFPSVTSTLSLSIPRLYFLDPASGQTLVFSAEMTPLPNSGGPLQFEVTDLQMMQ